jgi:hypothetical protein
MQVKQARDAVTLYHLEESGSSEDERDIDEYLRGRITEHIAGKTAQQLLREGKMSALPNFEPRD